MVCILPYLALVSIFNYAYWNVYCPLGEHAASLTHVMFLFFFVFRIGSAHGGDTAFVVRSPAGARGPCAWPPAFPH
jgi:hypothetical protein